VVTTRQEDRDSLSETEKYKLQRDATETLNTKFQLTSITDSSNQLRVTYSLGMRVNDLRQKMIKYDMIDVFSKLITPNPADPNAPLQVEDLLIHYADIPLIKVKAHVRFLNYYGQVWDKQNLLWTQALLENSCESSLRDKVMEQTLGIDKREMGGPTFFAIMMKVIVSLSEEGMRAMIEKIRMMKIRDIQGENVEDAVGLLRVSIGRLSNMNKVPVNLIKQLTTIFQTTSVDRFNRLFENVESTIRLKVATFTADDLLDLAEGTYREYVECGTWNAIDKSTFINDNQGQSEGSTCWNCGAVGHRSSDCPQPKKSQTAPTGGKGKDGWKTIPPLVNEPVRHDNNGKTYFWCGHNKCKRWNLTHVTSKHKAGVGKYSQRPPVTPDVPRTHVSQAPESVVAPEYRDGPRVSFADSIRDAVGHIHGLS